MRPVILATSVCAIIVTEAEAASTWDNGAGSGNVSWGTATNWNPDGVPASGTDVLFGSSGSEATLDADRVVGLLTFNAVTDFTIDRPAATTYTLTINTGITVSLPSRTNRNYSISAPILLGGDNVWNLANNFQGSNTGTVTISGGIGETGGSRSLTKSGISSLILTAAGTYTGATTITNGIFNLANNTATLASSDVTTNGGTSAIFSINNSSTVDDTNTVRAKSLTLNGGEFKVTGVAGFRSIDSITGGITIGAGPSIITAASGNHRTVIQADSLTRTSNAGYTIFRGDSLGASAANSGGTAATSNIMFTNAPSSTLFTGANGLAGTKQMSILAWAVGDTSASGLGAGFVTYDAANGIRLLNTSTEYAATASGAATNDNVRVTATDMLAASKTINALLLAPSATTTLTLSSGANLTIGSGALLMTGSQNTTIGGAGALDFGSNTTAFLSAVGTTGTKQITANIVGAGTMYKFGDANLTINGAISDGASGPTNLVVGQGTLTLGGSSSYTGTTTIQRGRITITSDALKDVNGALGNAHSAIILGDASSTESEGINLYLGNGVTFGRDITATLPQLGNPDAQRYRIGIDSGSATVATTTTVTIGNAAGGRRLELVAAASSATLDFQGVIVNTGTVVGPVLINGSSAGTGTVRLSNSSSSFVNGVTIVNGTLVLGASVAATGNSPIGTGSLVFYEGATPASGATLGLLMDGNYTFARTVTLGGSSTTGGYTAVIGSNTANTSATFSGTISSNSDVKTKNIQALAGLSTTTVTFSGQINPNNDATGVTNLEKTGAGTVVLSNSNNTYDGTTTVTAGTLLVNGTLATSASGVTVNAGGTLGGTGTINRAVTVNANGVIAPGSTVTGVDYAQLDTGSLVIAANSLFSLDIGGSGLFDQLNVTGTVSLAGTLQENLLNGYDGSGANTFYLLLNDGTDAITGTFAGLPQGSNVSLNGFNYTISYTANGDGGSVGNDVALIASVPEPTTMLSLFGGVALLAGRRRRRKQ